MHFGGAAKSVAGGDGMDRVGTVKRPMRGESRRPVPEISAAAAGTRLNDFVREMNTDGVVVARTVCSVNVAGNGVLDDSA